MKISISSNFDQIKPTTTCLAALKRLKYPQLTHNGGNGVYTLYGCSLMSQENVSLYYYENMPMQYTVIFHGCKNGYFQLKLLDIYTPGIYADGYLVFAFPFVRSYVRMFVRNSVTFVEFASKFCVKVSQVVYISATTHQKAFIFGP